MFNQSCNFIIHQIIMFLNQRLNQLTRVDPFLNLRNIQPLQNTRLIKRILSLPNLTRNIIFFEQEKLHLLFEFFVLHHHNINDGQQALLGMEFYSLFVGEVLFDVVVKVFDVVEYCNGLGGQLACFQFLVEFQLFGFANHFDR